MADSEKKLCRLVSEFGRVCRRKLKVNVGLNEEPLEKVNCFLESQVTAGGGCERDVVHRINERYKA